MGDSFLKFGPEFEHLLGLPRNAKNAARDMPAPDDMYVELGDGRLKKIAAKGEMISFAIAKELGLITDIPTADYETKEGDLKAVRVNADGDNARSDKEKADSTTNDGDAAVSSGGAKSLAEAKDSKTPQPKDAVKDVEKK